LLLEAALLKEYFILEKASSTVLKSGE